MNPVALYPEGRGKVEYPTQKEKFFFLFLFFLFFLPLRLAPFNRDLTPSPSSSSFSKEGFAAKGGEEKGEGGRKCFCAQECAPQLAGVAGGNRRI